MKRFGKLFVVRKPLTGVQVTDVSPCNEGSITSAGNYDDPYILVVFKVFKLLRESVQGLGIECIERARTIYRQYCHASISEISENWVFHNCFFLRLGCAARHQ